MNAYEHRPCAATMSRACDSIPTVLEIDSLIALEDVPSLIDERCLNKNYALETIAGRTYVRSVHREASKMPGDTNE